MSTTTRPAWATDAHATTNDDGSGLWYEHPVGRGYYVPGIGHEPDTMLDDEPVTFTLMYCPGNEDRETGAPDVYVNQENYFAHMSFASADAMRRYARVLLEVADDVERVTGGAL